MATTPNMSLEAWDLAKDTFQYIQLAENFETIDRHDHSEGHGARIKTSGIEALAITHPLIGVEAVEGNNVKKHTLGSEQIESNFLPIGTIIAWYPWPGGPSTPGGSWIVCEGQEWKTVPNAMGLTTGAVPDLRGRFIQGADTRGEVAPVPGSTGGSSSVDLAHAHSVEAHIHNVPAHTHPIAPHAHTISADGSHYHAYIGSYNNGKVGTPTLYNLFRLRVKAKKGSGGDLSSEDTEVVAFLNEPLEPSQSQAELKMEFAGTHNHSGFTGYTGMTTEASSSFATSAASPSTNVELGNVSTLPPYYSLLYIMKVR